MLATSSVALVLKIGKLGIAIIVAVLKLLPTFLGSIYRVKILEDERSCGDT